jgi:hypothetical protein
MACAEETPATALETLQAELAAGEPKKAAGDGWLAENYDLRERLEVARALAADDIVCRKNRGLVITKLQAPGSV